MSRRKPVLGGQVVFHGVVFDIVHLYQEHAGNTPYEFAVADDSVRVYPIDGSGTVWLEIERRPGVFGERPILRSISGSIEEDETPESAAGREMAEELGLTGGELRVFHVSVPNLKLVNRIFHVVATGWTMGVPHPEPDEDIDPFTVQLNAIPDLVWGGQIIEDPIALALLKLNRLFAADYPEATR